MKATIAIEDKDDGNEQEEVYQRLLRISTTTSDGTPVDPNSPMERDEWVEAKATENFIRENPLLDYLDRYGEAKFVRDRDRAGYDERFDLHLAHQKRLRKFRQQVVDQLAIKREIVDLEGCSSSDGHALRATLDAMARGAPIIAYGELWDPDAKTRARVDLIVRSDVVATDIPFAIGDEPEDDFWRHAPNLAEGTYHYRIVYIVDKDLGDFDSRDNLGPGKLALAVRNRIAHKVLARVQGYEPEESYLLGVDWQANGVAPVEHDREDQSEAVAKTTRWIRELQSQGRDWSIVPSPTRPELWPNLRAKTISGWDKAIHEIAAEVRELTALPYVTLEHRAKAHAAGITRWDDPRLKASVFGYEATSRKAALIDTILKAQRSEGDGLPDKIWHASRWRVGQPVEIFVGIETADLPDGTSMVYLITWRVRLQNDDAPIDRQTVAYEFSKAAEADLFRRWRDEVIQFASDAGYQKGQIRIYRWGLAGYVPDLGLDWEDLYERLVRREPLSVKGALNQTLITMAHALARLGRIQCSWPQHPADGGEAMAAAINTVDGMAPGTPVESLELVQRNVAFGLAHCAAIQAVLDHLRAHH